MKYRLNKGSTISKASVRHKSSKISCNRIEIAALQWSNVGLELLQSCCTSNPNPSKIQAPCNVPTLVDGISGIKKVACGTSHTLALSDDGQVYAWGQAFYGALGLDPNDLSLKNKKGNSLDNCYSPVMLPASSFNSEAVKNLEAGSRHSIFVTT